MTYEEVLNEIKDCEEGNNIPIQLWERIILYPRGSRKEIGGEHEND